MRASTAGVWLFAAILSCAVLADARGSRRLLDDDPFGINTVASYGDVSAVAKCNPLALKDVKSVFDSAANATITAHCELPPPQLPLTSSLPSLDKLLAKLQAPFTESAIESEAQSIVQGIQQPPAVEAVLDKIKP